MLVKPMENRTKLGGEGEGERLTLHLANEKKLLRTLIVGLYREPLESALRETLSNAFDATRDAERTRGTGDGIDPIARPVVTLDRTEKTLSIRDFGLGMSSEFIREKFVGLGNSTKDQSDDDIGGFGLGAKSVYAYNSFSIDSQTMDERTILLCVIEGDDFTLDKVSVPLDPERGTGTEVVISLKTDRDIEEVKKYLKLLKIVNVEELGLGTAFDVKGFDGNEEWEEFGKKSWRSEGPMSTCSTVLLDEATAKELEISPNVRAISVIRNEPPKYNAEGPLWEGTNDTRALVISVGGIPYSAFSGRAESSIPTKGALVVFHYRLGSWTFTPSREDLVLSPGSLGEKEKALIKRNVSEKAIMKIREAVRTVGEEWVLKKGPDSVENMKGEEGQMFVTEIARKLPEPLRTISRLLILNKGPSREKFYRDSNGEWKDAKEIGGSEIWGTNGLPRLVLGQGRIEAYGKGKGLFVGVSRSSYEPPLDNLRRTCLYQPGLNDALQVFKRTGPSKAEFPKFLASLYEAFVKHSKTVQGKELLKTFSEHTLLETKEPFYGLGLATVILVNGEKSVYVITRSWEKESLQGLPQELVASIAEMHKKETVKKPRGATKGSSEEALPERGAKPSRDIPGVPKVNVKTRSEAYLVTETSRGPIADMVTRVGMTTMGRLQFHQGNAEGLVAWSHTLPSENRSQLGRVLIPVDDQGRLVEVNLLSVMSVLSSVGLTLREWQNDIYLSDEASKAMKKVVGEKNASVILLEKGRLLAPIDRCWTAMEEARVEEMYTSPLTEMFNISVEVGEENIPVFEANPQKRPSEYGLPYNDDLVGDAPPHPWARALALAANFHTRNLLHRKGFDKESLGICWREFIDEVRSTEEVSKETLTKYFPTHAEVFLTVMSKMRDLAADIASNFDSCDVVGELPPMFGPLLEPHEEVSSDLCGLIYARGFFDSFGRWEKGEPIFYGSFVKEEPSDVKVHRGILAKIPDSVAAGLLMVLGYPRRHEPLAVLEAIEDIDLKGLEHAFDRFRERRYYHSDDEGLSELNERFKLKEAK